MEQTHDHILSLAAAIVSAHIGNHATAPEALPSLIREVYLTLAEVEPEPVGASRQPLRASAPRRTGVSADQLTCKECGLTMKMLKRHLITVHGLTPDEYRTKWGLASDEPMVTADYARLRSTLAKQSGLGKRPEVKSKPTRSVGRPRRR